MNYVIGNLNGNFNALFCLLKKVNFSKQDNLYILGDFIGSDEQSIHIIDFIMSKNNIYPIIGDKEEQFILAFSNNDKREYYEKFLEGEKNDLFFLYQKNLWYKERHIKYLSELPKYIETEKFIFSHTGQKAGKNEFIINKLRITPALKKSEKQQIFAHYGTNIIKVPSGIYRSPSFNAICLCNYEDGKKVVMLNLTKQQSIIYTKKDRF